MIKPCDGRRWLHRAVRYIPTLVLGGLLSVSFVAGAQEQDAVSAHLERAETALGDQDYLLASREYRLAAELDDNPEVAKRAARVGYTFGFNRDGLRSAERWLALEPDSEEALLYVAQLNLRLGDLSDARRAFARLIEGGESEEAAADRLLSLLPILAEEDPDDAARLMRRLARPYRDTAFGQYALAVTALQAENTEDAKDSAERAIELEPEWIRPKLVYARALLLEGDAEGAIDYAARIVGDNPQPDPEARLELAVMYLSAGRDDDALSQVNQVLLEQPSRSDALRMLAILNFRGGNLDAAWDDFQDLLSSGRYTMDALYYLGRIADQREEHEQAIALYSRVTRGQHVALAQRRAAGLIAESGEEEAAIQHLRQTAETHPDQAIDMLSAEAQLLASLERYDEALALYDRLHEFRPQDENTMLGRAELLVRMDRIDAAVEQYRQALKQNPDSASTMNALGYTLADRTTKYREAARLIRRALKLEPDNPAIIDSMGWVLYRQGKPAEALGYLRQAYVGFPDPEVAAHIIEVLWKLERTDEARELLEEVEQEAPDHPLIKDIRQRAFPSAAN